MSPHVSNFVHDLVAMAQATERLPQLEDEVATLYRRLQDAEAHNRGLELNIIGYKDQIDQLHSKVRSLEVERDEASFRVMEVETRAADAFAALDGIKAHFVNAMNALQPPKPEPVVEEIHKPAPDGGESAPNPTASSGETGPSEQSPSPTTTESGDGTTGSSEGQSDPFPTASTHTEGYGSGTKDDGGQSGEAEVVHLDKPTRKVWNSLDQRWEDKPDDWYDEARRASPSEF